MGSYCDLNESIYDVSPQYYDYEAFLCDKHILNQRTYHQWMGRKTDFLKII